MASAGCPSNPQCDGDRARALYDCQNAMNTCDPLSWGLGDLYGCLLGPEGCLPGKALNCAQANSNCDSSATAYEECVQAYCTGVKRY
jgi:hypothetical protein